MGGHEGFGAKEIPSAFFSNQICSSLESKDGFCSAAVENTKEKYSKLKSSKLIFTSSIKMYLLNQKQLNIQKSLNQKTIGGKILNF